MSELQKSYTPKLQSTNTHPKFKIVLLGNSSVGKTSLALRFAKDEFKDYYQSTMGAAFLTKTIELKNCIIELCIWDTCGQERFRCMLPMYYRNSSAAIIVYNVVDATSWEEAKSWISELNKNADSDIVVMMAGNKLDLVNTIGRSVQLEDVKEYCTKKSLMFLETSAKTGYNVNKLFEMIAERLVEKMIQNAVKQVDDEEKVVVTKKPNEQKWKCCK